LHPGRKTCLFLFPVTGIPNRSGEEGRNKSRRRAQLQSENRTRCQFQAPNGMRGNERKGSGKSRSSFLRYQAGRRDVLKGGWRNITTVQASGKNKRQKK